MSSAYYYRYCSIKITLMQKLEEKENSLQKLLTILPHRLPITRNLFIIFTMFL